MSLRGEHRGRNQRIGRARSGDGLRGSKRRQRPEEPGVSTEQLLGEEEAARARKREWPQGAARRQLKTQCGRVSQWSGRGGAMRRGYWPLYNARVTCDDSKQESASLLGVGSVWRNAQVLSSRERETRKRATRGSPLPYSSRGLRPTSRPRRRGREPRREEWLATCMLAPHTIGLRVRKVR